MASWLTPLTGAARNLGGTAAGMTLDLASGAARLGEAAVDGAAGRRRLPGVLRVQVIILSDAKGALSTQERVRPALAAADRTFRDHAGIRIRITGVRTITEAAPERALDPRANRALLLDDVLGRTDFYRSHLKPPDQRGTTALIGEPITVVVVRHIAGNTTGCSLGISANWVITQAALFDETNTVGYDETVLAHELGHAVNLTHHRSRKNLMFPESSPPSNLRGTLLTPWQRAFVQGNRHVIPGVPATAAAADPTAERPATPTGGRPADDDPGQAGRLL